MNYPISLGISYKTDTEYQKCFCALINQTVTSDQSFDDEWDEDNVTLFLNFIYTKTSTIESFQQLYLDAAATMMSIDPEIGVAILFSFTYFEIFHQCIVSFFNNKKIDDDPSFLLLKSMLIKV